MSLESTPSSSTVVNFEKRTRYSSFVFDEVLLPVSSDMMVTEPEPTLADVIALLCDTAKVGDLDKLAKQDDLIKLQATVASQALEIQQLRDTMTLQSKRLQNLEDTIGQKTASAMNPNQIQPDTNVNRGNKHGGPHEVNIRLDDQRHNLVFKGLPQALEAELEPHILQICTALSIIAYPSDIESITIMKQRDLTIKKPPPVLVAFNQLHVRSALLRLKPKLGTIPRYVSVFINPYEPIEFRRNKATFRKIAYKAQQDGKIVLVRNEWIQIDEYVYYVADLDKIPDQYKPTPMPNTNELESGKNCDPVQPMEETNGAAGSAPPKLPLKPRSRTKTYIRIKIKLTKAGLTFSGPSAFLSHMYNCDFTFDNTPYTSVEQGLHHIHATHDLEFEMAETIMDLYNAVDIKDVAKSLSDSEEWNKMAPKVLQQLNQAKYDQNPDLKQKLIETAPHPIVEATVDTKWGGSCPFGLDIWERNREKGPIGNFSHHEI